MHPIPYPPFHSSWMQCPTQPMCALYDFVCLYSCVTCSIVGCNLILDDSRWFSMTPSSHVLPTERARLKSKEITWRPTNPLLHGITLFGSYWLMWDCLKSFSSLKSRVRKSIATSGVSVSLESHVLVKEQVAQPWPARELKFANTHCKYQVATSLTRCACWLPKTVD